MMRNVLLIAMALVGFGVVHSLVAGHRLKDYLRSRWGDRLVEGWYRLAYNLVAFVTIAPVLVLMIILPDQTLYRVGAPWKALLRALQAFGAIGLMASLLFTDILRFAGLRQAYAYLTGARLPLPAEPLQERGPYALMRHPLYLFSLLIIWPQPVMTLNVLVFDIIATLYFAVGSLIEERRLERIHGDEYRAYRECVPWLLPWPNFKPGKCSRRDRNAKHVRLLQLSKEEP